MRRVTDFLRRNWPLRLGAILLATVLYTGLVLAQNVRTWTGAVPVDPIRPPTGATLLADPDPVTLIRYRAPLDVGVLSPDSFRATVDLSRVDAVPGGDAVSVAVTVVALDSRVQVVDFQPHLVEIRLDPVEVRELPVTVSLGSVAEGLTVGPPQAEPNSVTLRGASSRVNAVTQVIARVTIDASALNVDREVQLVAVDGNGNPVPNVEIDPERARVRIAVARELATVTLPVVPMLSGQPAFGYRISAVKVEPLVVTVSGEAATVARLDSAPTLPISVQGRTTDLEATIGLGLPDGVSVSGSDRVQVTITIVRDVGSRSIITGLTLEGAEPGLRYTLNRDQVEVILFGPLDVLAAVDAATISATVDVSGLDAGTHQVTIAVAPIVGLDVVVGEPPSPLIVTVTSAAPSASP